MDKGARRNVRMRKEKEGWGEWKHGKIRRGEGDKKADERRDDDRHLSGERMMRKKKIRKRRMDG